MEYRTWERKVTPVEGELLQFDVESDSNPHFPWRVDLREFEYQGGCDCMDFRVRVKPLMRDRTPAPGKQYGFVPEQKRCPHVRSALRYFLREWIPRVDVYEKKRDAQNKPKTNKFARGVCADCGKTPFACRCEHNPRRRSTFGS